MDAIPFINKGNKMMIWCEKYKINVDIEFYCSKCSFFRENKCDYNNWYPGLKKGREWNDINKEQYSGD